MALEESFDSMGREYDARRHTQRRAEMKTQNPYADGYTGLRKWWSWGYKNGKLENGTYTAPSREETDFWEAWERGVAASIMDRLNAEADAAREASAAERVTARPPSRSRKDAPMFSGVLAYFPDALEEVARLSKAGNDKHNPGEPLHWSRDKSSDHKDCIVRHLKDAGTIDEEDGFYHDVKVAWRALANLQILLESKRS